MDIGEGHKYTANGPLLKADLSGVNLTEADITGTKIEDAFINGDTIRTGIIRRTIE